MITETLDIRGRISMSMRGGGERVGRREGVLLRSVNHWRRRREMGVRKRRKRMGWKRRRLWWRWSNQNGWRIFNRLSGIIREWGLIE